MIISSSCYLIIFLNFNKHYLQLVMKNSQQTYQKYIWIKSFHAVQDFSKLFTISLWKLSWESQKLSFAKRKKESFSPKTATSWSHRMCSRLISIWEKKSNNFKFFSFVPSSSLRKNSFSFLFSYIINATHC